MKPQQMRTAQVAAERRQRLLDLVARGLTQVEIAAEVGVSPQRVSALLKLSEKQDPHAVHAARGEVRCPHCGLYVKVPPGGQPPIVPPSRSRL